MKNYVEPKLDVDVIVNDIITDSSDDNMLPILGGKSDILG